MGKLTVTFNRTEGGRGGELDGEAELRRRAAMADAAVGLRFRPGLAKLDSWMDGEGGGRSYSAWGARKSSGAAKNGRDGCRRRLCSAWLVPSARTKERKWGN